MNEKLLEFILKIYNLRLVKREITKPNGERENDAEHTLMAIFLVFLLDDFIPKEVDRLELVFQILVHDMPEIYAGDTYYLADRKGKYSRELEAAKELFDGFPNFMDAWMEYEHRLTITSRQAKEFDLASAVLSLISNEGFDWKQRGTTERIERSYGDRILVEGTAMHSFLMYVYDYARDNKYFAPESGEAEVVK